MADRLFKILDSRYDEQSVEPLVHVYLALQPSQMKDSASANFILLESYPGCTKLCKNISQSLSLDIFFSCSWDIFAIWPIMSSHSYRWLNLRRYFDFGPIANNCHYHSPEQKIYLNCLLSRVGNLNFLHRRVIWHLFLAMGLKSKYLLRLNHHALYKRR